MGKRWVQRPPGSNWGDFGDDDRLGRLNYLTEATTLNAAKEIQTGKRFSLSLPLDIPVTNATNQRRLPPALKPVIREGKVLFNQPVEAFDPGNTGVVSDDAVLLYNQHSTQWDAFGHMGALFDANGDGVDEPIQYNGFSVLGEHGTPRYGELGAWELDVVPMAQHGVQGRGVMINLRKHYGFERHAVSYDDLMRILESDGVSVEKGDIVCLYTGYADKLIELGEDVHQELPTTHCPAFDGKDTKLLNWITDSELAILVCDNRAVEYEHGPVPEGSRAPGLPLHELCLFKLGIHLGEMWYLTELAQWLEANGRYRFFLTAPPLYMPGAVGSPACPVATV